MGCLCSKETHGPLTITPPISKSNTPDFTPPKQSTDVSQGPVHGMLVRASPHGGQQVPIITPTQPIAFDEAGHPRPESPGMRITSRVLNKQQQQEDIVTVWDDASSPHSSNPQTGTNKPADLPGATQVSGPEVDDGEPQQLRLVTRQDSTKASAPALVTIEQDSHDSHEGDPLEVSLQGLKPMSTAQPMGKPRYPPPSEMVLNLSSDEDDDSSHAGFNMLRWKRHYHWNKNKHQELLRFLWKHFDKQHWTVYCLTHKLQGALFAPYQGENIIHGFQCRVQQFLGTAQPGAHGAAPAGSPTCGVAGSDGSAAPLPDLFGVLHALMSKDDSDGFKVLGVLIAKGHGSSPACLSGLQELQEDWYVKPADVSDPLVRTFVSNLITAQPPAPHYLVTHTREII